MLAILAFIFSAHQNYSGFSEETDYVWKFKREYNTREWENISELRKKHINQEGNKNTT